MVWVPPMGRVIFGFDGLLVICGTAERGEKFGFVTTSSCNILHSKIIRICKRSLEGEELGKRGCGKGWGREKNLGEKGEEGSRRWGSKKSRWKAVYLI